MLGQMPVLQQVPELGSVSTLRNINSSVSENLNCYSPMLAKKVSLCLVARQMTCFCSTFFLS